MLTKHLEEVKAIGLSAIELYVNALGEFGGVASSLPSEPSAYNIFALMESNFTQHPSFVGGAIDFGALSSATNLSKILVKSGCEHAKGLRKKMVFESLMELGESSQNLHQSVKNLMSSFWLEFGWANARSLAKACRATGMLVTNCSFLLVSSLFQFCVLLCLC